MELLLISDSKLKVTLSAEDMNRFSLNCDTIDYDNTETRRAFWQILDEAKHKTGFDAARDRVFIQVYPSRSGGCEMYVIKLKNMAKATDVNAKGQTQTNGKVGVFSFDGIDILLPVCKKLHNMGYERESAAYAGDDGRFYLVITEKCRGAVPSSSREPSVTEFGFIEEYGKRYTDPARLAYITEHSRVIDSTNAVNILAALA